MAFLTFSIFSTYAPLNHKLTEAEFEFEFQDLPATTPPSQLVVVVMEGCDNRTVLQVADRMGLPVLLLTPDGRHAGLFSLQWRSNGLAPLGEVS